MQFQRTYGRTAVPYALDVQRTTDDPFAEQESRGQFVVLAWRPHRDRNALLHPLFGNRVSQADFQRLLNGQLIQCLLENEPNSLLDRDLDESLLHQGPPLCGGQNRDRQSRRARFSLHCRYPFGARFRLKMRDPVRIGWQGLPLIAEAQGEGTNRARSGPQLADEAHQGLIQIPWFRVEVCEGLQQLPFQLQPDKVRSLIAKPLRWQKLTGRQHEQGKVTRSHGTNYRTLDFGLRVSVPLGNKHNKIS